MLGTGNTNVYLQTQCHNFYSIDTYNGFKILFVLQLQLAKSILFLQAFYKIFDEISPPGKPAKTLKF